MRDEDADPEGEPDGLEPGEEPDEAHAADCGVCVGDEGGGDDDGDGEEEGDGEDVDAVAGACAVGEDFGVDGADFRHADG